MNTSSTTRDSAYEVLGFFGSKIQKKNHYSDETMNGRLSDSFTASSAGKQINDPVHPLLEM